MGITICNWRTGAVLHASDLKTTKAALREALERGADLSGADLRGANLSDADLSGADLRGANLRGADLIAIPNIDAAILVAIDKPGAALDMASWHTCETTHCRAGWAITLAGPAGKMLEALWGPAMAGALIYAASGSHPIPDFYANNETAMADMRARAKAAAK